MPGMPMDDAVHDGEHVHLVLENHRGLTAILQAVKATSKQVSDRRRIRSAGAGMRRHAGGLQVLCMLCTCASRCRHAAS